ncbi:MAG TPA: lipopolysaccharide biosynthesis protein, partial [Caulobacteraceae bacterium]|nr:lipopolysaccharide biosynthesis protein [Caulobacteraceae bacterium]
MKKSPDVLLRRFAGQAGVALSLRVLWAVITFAGAALLARWFSASDYGRYAAITSLITFLSVVCALGLPNALVRKLGEFGGRKAEGEQASLAHGTLRLGISGSLIASVAAAILLALGAVVLHLAGRGPDPLVFVAGAALLPAFTLIDVQGAAARSYGRVVTALAPRDVVWRLLLIPLAWGVTVMLPQDRQLTTFLFLAALMLMVLALWQAWSLRRATPAAIRTAPPIHRLGELARVSAVTWVTQVAGAVFRSMDVVIAGIFLPPREVGFYFAASRIAGLISFVLVSTNLIVGPDVARLHYAGEQARLTRTLKLASVIIFVPSLLTFLACVLFPRQLLSLFGAEFVRVWPVLAVLAVAQLANAATGAVGVVLMMTGLERKNAEVLLTSSAAMIAAMVVLTPLYGTLGTAAAVCGGQLLANARVWLVARRHTAYDPSILGLLWP